MNIEEFVNSYLQEHCHDVLLNPYNGLIDFANTFKEQMLKDAVEGWVAVDADTVGNRRVSFFPQKPVRDLLTRYKYWAATRPNYEVIRLDSDAFPDIKWEDEPKKVRIVVLKAEEE